jgi:hypothetical protein
MPAARKEAIYTQSSVLRNVNLRSHCGGEELGSALIKKAQSQKTQ